jgi:hypothetical protein
MGLLDKIKSDLRKADAVLITPNSVELEQEQLPILNAVNDDEVVPQKEEVNDLLFPFKSRNELKEKATELKNFFSGIVIDEKKFFTEKKCSGPFEGAKTFFFYNIKLPDGSTSSEKVASYYPPQVKSCLVDEKEIARLEKKLKDKKVSQAEKSLIKIVKN